MLNRKGIFKGLLTEVGFVTIFIGCLYIINLVMAR